MTRTEMATCELPTLPEYPPPTFDASCLDVFDEVSQDPGCLFWASSAFYACLDTADFPQGFTLRSNTPEAA